MEGRTDRRDGRTKRRLYAHPSDSIKIDMILDRISFTCDPRNMLSSLKDDLTLLGLQWIKQFLGEYQVWNIKDSCSKASETCHHFSLLSF